MKDRKYIFMCVYNSLDYDQRVMKTVKVINELDANIIILSNNTKIKLNSKNIIQINASIKKKGIFGLLQFYIFTIKMFLKYKEKIKLVYIHDYNISIIGFIIYMLYKIKYIYDAHELLLKCRSCKYSLKEYIFLKFEKATINCAELIIEANDERKNIISRIYKKNNVISVLNINTNKIYDKKIDSKKEDVIVYQGILSESREISSIIRIMKYLPENIILKLIGDGPDKNYYEQLVYNLNINKKVIFKGMISSDQIYGEIKTCKLGIVYYKMDSLNNYYCSPNKIYDYAQCGIPMLFSEQPFFKKIVEKYKIGELFNTKWSNEKKVDIIIRILENYKYYQRNMALFLEDYNYENESDKLKSNLRQYI